MLMTKDSPALQIYICRQEITPQVKGKAEAFSLSQSLAPDPDTDRFLSVLRLISELVQHENKASPPHPSVISNFYSFKDAGGNVHRFINLSSD